MEWRPIPSFLDYQVSEFGDVQRIKPGIRGGIVGKIMKPYVREDGYRMYILRKDNKSFHRKAHQLVIEAFVALRPSPKAEARHKDGTRHNDHFTNLEWGTSTDNKADMLRHGTRLSGERSPRAKLTNQQAKDIREIAKGGISQAAIGAQFGVSQKTISRIVNLGRYVS